MNAESVPLEAPKERSRVCFGGFRPLKHGEGLRLRAVTYFGVQARSLRPWMNAERVPFEALKERSRVCFGGFRLPVRSPASRSLAEGRRFGEGRPL